MVPLAIVTAIVIVAGWFPATALWHQQAQIDATTTQIDALQHQEQSLQQQSKTIDSKAAAIQLAREQYQLVAPGQSLIQVLPENSAGEVTASSSDPGFQPLVSPTASAPLTTHASTSTSSHRAGFVSRLVRTLEFWR
jgi:multidrug efflux pump subunit AcrA (membrane-fusion protein)